MSRENYVYTVILKRDGKEIKRWVLADKPLSIGRARGSDIVIDDPSVSREHALLQRVGDDYVIRDRGSRNGMNVNGTVVESTKLQDGDIVVLGEHRLFFQCRDARQPDDFASVESTIRGVDYDSSPRIDDPAFVVMTTALGEQTFALDHPIISIGSGPDVDIRVEGRFVAPYHADIVHSDGTYTLNHVEGRRKVLVNSKPVKQRVLEHGDTIGIANATFFFRQTARAGAGHGVD